MYQAQEAICAERAAKQANFIGMSARRVSWAQRKLGPVFEAGVHLSISSKSKPCCDWKQENSARLVQNTASVLCLWDSSMALMTKNPHR